MSLCRSQVGYNLVVPARLSQLQRRVSILVLQHYQVGEIHVSIALKYGAQETNGESWLTLRDLSAPALTSTFTTSRWPAYMHPRISL